VLDIEFHFDFGSPNAFLAHLALPQVEGRTGAKFRYVPVLLGGVFKATNNQSPAVALEGVKNKPEYIALETRRFVRRYGIEPYVPNPHFPVNTLRIMRGAAYALDRGYFERYVDAVFRHMWRQAGKMDDAEVIREALASAGLPADEILEGAQQANVKQALIDNTERSVAMGTFGAPTFYVGGDIFFGKDKLGEVEEAIRERQGAASY